VSANADSTATGGGPSRGGSDPSSDDVTGVGSATPILRARNMSKSFGGRRVLESLNLDVLPGSIHALVGQNGAGKSTFIKILAGVYEPDEEEGAGVWIRGQSVPIPLDPSERGAYHFAFVHQDLGLIESVSVLENVRVRNFSLRSGWRIPWRSERRHVKELLERFDVDVSPDQHVSDLTQVQRTGVAIVRAFDQLSVAESGLLVLDEPTAALPRDGIQTFFAAVNRLKAAGFGVLFVSHRLEEVFELTDHVTVIRDGRLAHSGPTSELDEDQLIEHILGFSLERLYPEPHEPTREVLAKLEDVSGPLVSDLSVTLHKGEIVGVTGLLGSGWEELPYLLFGATEAKRGKLHMKDREVELKGLTPRAAIKLGCALLPGNRLVDGSLQTATVKENLTLTTLDHYFSGGRLRRGRERSHVQELLHGYDVRPPEPDVELASLSGGNQQKVLVAKWFETEPSLLLLHEPTHGIDVGARAAIFERLRDAAASGVAVILATSEYEDLPHLCDRVLVFREGRVASELHGANLTYERIVEQCFRTS
jgi:ribose transport system ATP-binding protein